MPSSLPSSTPPIPISSLCSFLRLRLRLRPRPASGGFAAHQMTTRASSSPSSAAARAFQLRFNPLTGDSEWVVVDEEEQEDTNGQDKPPKSLLATTSYLDMLNDTCRNRSFRRAIEATITKPCHVLDIGAGTGLLSMMAARTLENVEGEERGRVSACESYLPMGKLMRRVLRANGMDSKVKVFHRRSDDLRVGVELDSPADVLVSEILDSELLGEGLLPTLQQAHDKLLVKNPHSIPYRATIYGQLVESAFLWKQHDLYSSDVNASDSIHLTTAAPQQVLSIKQQQYAMHCDAISDVRLLSKPFKVFEFEFWKRPESHREKAIRIKATDNGRAHAIVSWWVLQLDHTGLIFYSTAPKWVRSSYGQNLAADITGVKDWCDHWKQCVWFIQGTGALALKDQYLSLRASHNDTSISYHVKLEGQVNCSPRSSMSEDNHLTLSPEKIALYGDKDWRMALITAIRNSLGVRSSPLCIVADDSVFLAVITASLSKSSTVFAIFPGIRDRGTHYIQAISDANGFSTDQIKVIGKRISSFLPDDIKQRKVDLLVGEPFYNGNEGALPWQNLRFWMERTLLDSILAEDASIMPCKGILKVCAMSLPDLWRSRRCLGDVEGFDHSIVNETLGACGELPTDQEGPCLPYYVWQCGHCEKLSEIYSIMDFNITERIHSCFGKTKIEFSNPGSCHGFVLWIDWLLDEKNSIILSTGPDSRYWKQGVQLLSKPVMVNAAESCAEVEASFDHITGELAVKSLFLQSSLGSKQKSN